MAGLNDDKDLMNIGEHCGVSTCGLLDFLPITCNHCKKQFCKVHSSVDGHCCTEVADNIREIVPDKIMRNFVCSFEGCSLSELTEVICLKCELNFCLKHRHQVDHKCTKIEVPEDRMKQTREHVQKLEPKEKPQSRGRKSSKTAAKVLLMKLKMKAVGETSIPETEKIYLLIAAPIGSKEKNKAIIVSKKWSIGRTIDTAASLMKLSNSNNVGGAKKLRLFNTEDGHAYEAPVALENTDLDNGSVAVMEYVNDGVDRIENLKDYSLS